MRGDSRWQGGRRQPFLQSMVAKIKKARVIRCKLIPACSNPKKDLASPLAQVSQTSAWRMCKRQSRMKARAQADEESQHMLPFPWNEGCRKTARGDKVGDRRPNISRPGCDVCGKTHSRDCTCGATLAKDTNLSALTSFVGLVRSPSTPIYNEQDPRDQAEFLRQLQNLLKTESEDVALRRLACYAGLAASSGRPESMEACLPSIRCDSDADSLSAFIAKRYVKEGETFWRGGQPHGGLKKKHLPDAVAAFLEEGVQPLADALATWVAADAAGKRSAVKSILAHVRRCGKFFVGSDYYCKRCLEICLLGGMANPNLQTMHPNDLDQIASWWPIARGTKKGARRIFPTARNDRLIREGLRVVQRSLGGGVRRVPLVRISAFLCGELRVFPDRCELPCQLPSLPHSSPRCDHYAMSFFFRPPHFVNVFC